MTVKTDQVAGRRTLRFESLADVQRDAETVSWRPAKTLGNWSVSQIIDHLARSIQAGFEGPQVWAPWFVRYLIAPVIKPRLLSKGMPAGFNMPKKMTHFMPGDDPNLAVSLQELTNWVDRLKAECPPLGHPAFGKLSHADWIRLHIRHGELHLSFIVPEPS